MDLASLDFEKLANAILILIVGIGGFFGLNQARKKNADPKTETLELAGALISGKDAKALMESVDALRSEFVAHRKALDRNTDALESNTDTCDEMRDNVKAVGQAMHNMTVELARSQVHERTIPPGCAR